jgi:hypothetical protein
MADALSGKLKCRLVSQLVSCFYVLNNENFLLYVDMFYLRKI